VSLQVAFVPEQRSWMPRFITEWIVSHSYLQDAGPVSLPRFRHRGLVEYAQGTQCENLACYVGPVF
jgi:hypothetical protein